MWMMTRFWLPGATVSGVMMKAFTPSMVVDSTFTFISSFKPGMTFLITPAAAASTIGFHSSPVFGSRSQSLRNGSAMTFWISGLTSMVGIGSVRAGTGSPDCCANAGDERSAKVATAAKPSACN
jgi:hypothetical protein